ncbi:MAG: 3-deoxy-D-manno-octulosonic acid transferase [Gammaproteobacteria bacterium]
MSNELLPYRVALCVSSPLLIGYTLWRAARDGGTDYLWQRLGGNTPAVAAPVWMHCASVGEVNAALPVLKALRARHPQAPLLVTTNTPTGRAVALKEMGADITHAYLPLDFNFSMARFLSRLRPRCLVVMETELWPNLYQLCATLDIPLILINARLSQRTLKAPSALRRAYRHALGQVRAILARSDWDAGKFQELGAPAGRVTTVGNIKFAAPGQTDALRLDDLVGRPYWLAASTHHQEELHLARIWRRLPATPELLVIAPRHPERRHAILKQLAPLGFEIAVRSRGDAVTSTTRIYLADTLGEMPALMTHAAFVFIGGSLIPHGGHNILEPARLAKAVLVGRHMDNFAEETQSLLSAEALLMAQDDRELGFALERLLVDAELRAALGERAAAFMRRHEHVLPAYLERLEPLCGLR